MKNDVTYVSIGARNPLWERGGRREMHVRPARKGETPAP